MTDKKKAPKDVDVVIARDGVFVAESVRKDKGDTVSLPFDIADALIRSGLAKRA